MREGVAVAIQNISLGLDAGGDVVTGQMSFGLLQNDLAVQVGDGVSGSGDIGNIDVVVTVFLVVYIGLAVGGQVVEASVEWLLGEDKARVAVCGVRQRVERQRHRVGAAGGGDGGEAGDGVPADAGIGVAVRIAVGEAQVFGRLAGPDGDGGVGAAVAVRGDGDIVAHVSGAGAVCPGYRPVHLLIGGGGGPDGGGKGLLQSGLAVGDRDRYGGHRQGDIGAVHRLGMDRVAGRDLTLPRVGGEAFHRLTACQRNRGQNSHDCQEESQKLGFVFH